MKFKVEVTDNDIQDHDRLDSLVEVLELAPASSESAATTWTRVIMTGLRSTSRTRWVSTLIYRHTW